MQELEQRAFQDLIPRNHCWGCGPDNEHGLHIKSYWAGDETVCVWKPEPWHMAGPTHVVNGGIIATLIDCHSVCTAIADAYRRERRSMESEPLIWYVTARLDITYRQPTPIEAPVELRARVREIDGRKSWVDCSLSSAGEERARGEVLAIRVAAEWHESESPAARAS